MSINIRELLTRRVHCAMQSAGIPAECPPHIAPSKKLIFGDYQANGAMAAAKIINAKPREIAQQIVSRLSLNDIAEKIEIAGPGFINIHLKADWLSKQVAYVCNRQYIDIPTSKRQIIVVDYSSPNLAKEMHVGHLRSTIIGDAMVRVLEFQGHQVIRQNHVGDWGTQFGMLVAELDSHLQAGESANLALGDLERFYKQSKKHFDLSPEFARKARDYVVKLQSGDRKVLALWQQFKMISLIHCRQIYKALNVSLTDKDVRGESAYNDDLAILVEELQQQQLVVEDQGAQVVFIEEIADKEGRPSPMIVQKRDGGFLYATTDLAALRYRANQLKADRILYFIDARQSLHMQQVFTIAKKAKFVDGDIGLEHHAFGTMMSSDGKPFKSRDGGTVKLAELLAEAVLRAEKILIAREADQPADSSERLNESERREIAQKVGIGSIKYADLTKTRTNDYVFNWKNMLSFEGNNAPYLQNAYTRIKSIFRRASIDPKEINSPIILNTDIEKSLAVKLLQFSETIEQVSKDAYPHLLCNYVYDLASLFMNFYERCPVLKIGITDEVKYSRLQLCDAVAKTLKTGLDLLGIETMERM